MCQEQDYNKRVIFGLFGLLIILTSTFSGLTRYLAAKIDLSTSEAAAKWFSEDGTSALNPYRLLTAISIKALTITLNKLR